MTPVEMTAQDQAQLDAYLKKIETALDKIPVADRADILMELHSHITDSTASQSLDEVLKALGEPHHVANRYLIARGVQPLPPPKKPVLRWVFGTFGVLALLTMIMVVVVIRSFFPILEVDEKNGRVRILGGMVDVDEESGRVSIGKGLLKIDADDAGVQVYSSKNRLETSTNRVRMDGHFKANDFKKLKIKANNAKLEVTSQAGASELHYQCKALQKKPGATLGELHKLNPKGVLEFDLTSGLLGSDCEFSLPGSIAIEATLDNGKIEFNELLQDVDASISNGKIEFNRAAGAKYTFDTRVSVGSIQGMDAGVSTPKAPGVHSAKLVVGNGKIEVN